MFGWKACTNTWKLNWNISMITDVLNLREKFLPGSGFEPGSPALCPGALTHSHPDNSILITYLSQSESKCMWKLCKLMVFWHRLYSVFTYIYSHLIKKDICECQNVSFKLACVCVCLMSEDLYIFSSFLSYCCAIHTLVLSFPRDFKVILSSEQSSPSYMPKSIATQITFLDGQVGY